MKQNHYVRRLDNSEGKFIAAVIVLDFVFLAYWVLKVAEARGL